MKRFLLIIAVALLLFSPILTAKKDKKTKKTTQDFVSVTTGLALPYGNFAFEEGNSKSGGAGTGFNLDLEGVFFGESGYAMVLKYQYFANPGDLQDNSIILIGDTWDINIVGLGFLYTIPISKIKVDLKLFMSYAFGSTPNYTYKEVKTDAFGVDGLAYSLGTNIKYDYNKRISFISSFAITGAVLTGKFNDRTVEQDFRNMTINVGASYNF